VSILVVRNDADDPVGLVGQWLSDIDIVTVCADAGEPVPDVVPDGIDGVILLGGAMGALDDDRAPWLPDERALVRDAVDRAVPVLGLCLGHQILAVATGGRIAQAGTPEVGVVSVTRTDAGSRDPIVAALPTDVVPAVQFHHDEVVELPPDAQVLLTNDACRIQGFRVGQTAYGLQMHPEVESTTFAHWAAHDDGTLAMAAVDADTAVAQVHAKQDDLQDTWRPVITRWASLVRS
jgi:GMP synthase (glutamine-hydrolysing)